MTYLACSRAEVIASKVGTSKKRKKIDFFDFHRQQRVKTTIIFSLFGIRVLSKQRERETSRFNCRKDTQI